MQNAKTIAVLGATGSAGMQALDVARARGHKVDFLSVNKNVKGAERAAREFSPRAVAVADESAAADLKLRLADTNVKVLAGKEGIIEGIYNSESETVVNAIIGEAGLMPSLAVIDKRKRLTSFR